MPGCADIIFSLGWRSRNGCHWDRQFIGGFSLDSDRLGPFDLPGLAGMNPGETRVLTASQTMGPRDPLAVERTSLQGWRLAPPRLGRHYPRGQLNTYPRTDLRPFRVMEIGAGSIVADFNAPLQGLELTLEFRLLEHVSVSAATSPADPVTTWLGSGPGMQAPLPGADTDFFAGQPFSRADESPDDRFYARDRLVDHLDLFTRQELTSRYRQLLRPGMEVLDLMASWNSHLPPEMPLTVTGLGMNQHELDHNPRLDHRIVHDLNQHPQLPFADASFDAALCALSIEYLIDPITVAREIGRILRPGAPFMISFSDRWFPPKAIRLWSELHPFERLALVMDYLRLAGSFEGLATESLQGLPAPKGTWRPQGRPWADPLFIVTGCRLR